MSVRIICVEWTLFRFCTEIYLLNDTKDHYPTSHATFVTDDYWTNERSLSEEHPRYLDLQSIVSRCERFCPSGSQIFVTDSHSIEGPNLRDNDLHDWKPRPSCQGVARLRVGILPCAWQCLAADSWGFAPETAGFLTPQGWSLSLMVLSTA